MLDPAILADVQRALKLKAQREVRLRTAGLMRTDASPHSFFSDSSSPTKALVSPEQITASPSSNHATGEDFITTSDAVVSHPIPRSLDNGATIDWSGKEVIEEPKRDKRWSLSINKRKTKDKATSISSLDHFSSAIPRDSDYDGLFDHYNIKRSFLPCLERVAILRAGLMPRTLRKASVIAEHIQRRYTFLYASLFPPSQLLNPLSILRWNAEQDVIVCLPCLAPPLPQG